MLIFWYALSVTPNGIEYVGSMPIFEKSVLNGQW